MDTQVNRLKKVIVRLRPEEYQKLLTLAQTENRSLSNYVATVMHHHLRLTKQRGDHET